MRISATFKCDSCGLVATITGNSLPEGWGSSRWVEGLLAPPPEKYAVPPDPPSPGTIQHVCSNNCRQLLERRYRGVERAEAAT